MKKFLLLLFLTGISVSAQVGVNTTTPNAQLDVKSSNQAAPLNTDGILIPKIDTFPSILPTVAQNGMLVFLTTTSGTNAPGFYYWDNATTSWKGIGGGKGWDIIGNSGTNPATNFIGTADDQDFIFKRNGVRAGIMGVNNVGFGVNALNPANTGTYNLAFGSNTLSSNTTGQENIAFGDGALYQNLSGGGNFASGSDAMRMNTTGSDNVALGKMALRTNDSGDDNFALGSNALTANDIGNRNLGIGSDALFANTSGSENIGIGANALAINQTGSYNIAIGTSMANSASGDNNVAIGSQAGNNIHTNNNLVLGYGADVPSAVLDNQLSIGNLIYGTDVGLAAGKIGIGETEPEERLHINDNLKLGKFAWIAASDDKLIKFGDGDFTMIGEAHGDDVLSFSAKNFIFNPSYSTGNVGIGTIGTPSEKLEVFGKTKTTNFQMTNGAAANRVLTSDALGNATWAATTANASFFEVGSSIPPDLNTDAMYHLGNVAIGKNTTAYKLDVLETNGANLSAALFRHSNPTSTVLATNALKTEIITPAALASGALVGTNNGVTVANAVSGTGTTNFVSGTTTNAAYGTENYVSAAGSGFRYGTTNIMSGLGDGTITGTRNSMTNTVSGYMVGTQNEFSGNNPGVHVGMLNDMGGSNNSTNIGIHTVIKTPTDDGIYGELISYQSGSTGGGLKYGVYIDMPTSIGGTHTGVYSDVRKEGSFSGYFLGKSLFSHTQVTASGDAQYTVQAERSRNTQNNGVNYSATGYNSALNGINYWGDSYSFALTGFNQTYTGSIRTGGILGADALGSYWASLGYKNSAGTNYGIYASTALASGTGRYSSAPTDQGIGGGFYGGLIGSWSRGTTIGSMSSGSLMAHFNNGNEYTNGHQVELVKTAQGITPAFSVTSSEIVVYKKGKIQLNNGTAHVNFDPAYARLLKDAPVVTATPMGPCNGVYIESIDAAGFTIREQNSGTGSALISWIAVGDRVDSDQGNVPESLLSGRFAENLDKVMFNENDKVNSALDISANGDNLNFGRTANTNQDPTPQTTLDAVGNH
ncbi:hypothetical protein [Flavobacterium silvaticum]|uniref:Peptidase S74 domain-containing protein n=1 Tax=Flavobacterium silvaticum TaxID=1852020 RepID=A0A972FML5_9FLAO|nr:hypothetical protein [Flavobacterium silvaticum]NMH28503.1 hypothetical protein [Flavobacterium silvaticum]